ncbi:hypothetical protein TNCT_378531 [Trichonephila clavata]|uniref:Uncharacterized protein n=1 Tax=Trichonephila clavata TaxID=2740835 RepID=A0A8X6FDM4_TRICU|nr:hypothetical protein TNCT_378531 [Trichonephila clavata]
MKDRLSISGNFCRNNSKRSESATLCDSERRCITRNNSDGFLSPSCSPAKSRRISWLLLSPHRAMTSSFSLEYGFVLTGERITSRTAVAASGDKCAT